MGWPLRVLLILNIAYCSLASLGTTLPGWKMFDKVEAMRFSLKDAEGRSIEVRDCLPAGAYFNSPRALLPVLGFICRSGRHPLPLVFEEQVRGVRLRIGAEDGCRTPDDL